MTPRNYIKPFGAGTRLVVLIAFGLTICGTAFAAGDASPVTSTASAPDCGKTVEDNLAAARALQSNDTTTRAALSCLLDAVHALNDRVRHDEEGKPASGVLKAPKIPDNFGSRAP